MNLGEGFTNRQLVQLFLIILFAVLIGEFVLLLGVAYIVFLLIVVLLVLFAAVWKVGVTSGS